MSLYELISVIQKEQALWKAAGKETLVLIPLNLDGFMFSDACTARETGGGCFGRGSGLAGYVQVNSPPEEFLRNSLSG